MVAAIAHQPFDAARARRRASPVGNITAVSIPFVITHGFEEAGQRGQAGGQIGQERLRLARGEAVNEAGIRRSVFVRAILRAVGRHPLAQLGAPDQDAALPPNEVRHDSARRPVPQRGQERMRRETSHTGRELRSRPLQVQHPVSSKLVHPYCPRGAPTLSMHWAAAPCGSPRAASLAARARSHAPVRSPDEAGHCVDRGNGLYGLASKSGHARLQ